MIARTDDVQNGLFLRKFGVPFWAIAHVFGRDHMFWYRAECALGRFSLVGTTVRKVDVPEHLLMRGVNCYFEDGQHMHGSRAANERHCRGWALLWNFAPWHPAIAKANQNHHSPVERLNGRRYHDQWLQNLLISASCGGYRHPIPQYP